MNSTDLDTWGKVTGNILLIALVLVIGLALLLYRQELRVLLGGVRRVKFKDFTAEFDEVAGNAFTAAAERVWKRTGDTPEYLTDPDFYFSDGDFSAAKQLQSMRPVQSWLPTIKPRARQNIRILVYNLADQYRKVRAEPPSDGRTKRASAVVARMRILAFAAHPMIPELMAADQAGERIAAIAFLQVQPCYKASVLEWLKERISSKEELLVQYHAVGALLAACRNAEASDMKFLYEVVQAAMKVCKKMRERDRSERALELLAWCQFSLDGKPFAQTSSDAGSHNAARPESKPA